MHFAALFEASRRDGSNKGPNDVIISVNKEGVTVLNPKYQAVIGFHYYDLLDVIADKYEPDTSVEITYILYLYCALEMTCVLRWRYSKLAGLLLLLL